MARRRGLGANNPTIEQIARDAEKEGRHADAKMIRQEMTSYRHLPAQKRQGSKIKRYKNLAVFNEECTRHGSAFTEKAMICKLKNIRRLADGSGMATVRVTKHDEWTKARSTRDGTWLLHFASHDLLKKHLKGRVETPTPIRDLGGSRRRRRG